MLLSREVYEKNRGLFHKLTLMPLEKLDRMLSLDLEEFIAQVDKLSKFVDNNKYSAKFLSGRGVFHNMMLEMYMFRNSTHIRLSDTYSCESDYEFDITDMDGDIDPFVVDLETEDGIRVCAILSETIGNGMSTAGPIEYELRYRVGSTYGSKYVDDMYIILQNVSKNKFLAIPNGPCAKCTACDKKLFVNRDDVKIGAGSNCDMSRCRGVVSGVSPIMVASIVTDAIRKYMGRSKEVRERWSSNRISRSVSVANESEGDVYRLLPGVEVTYSYKEPRVYEWKGGHHASPVAHTRKSHYRRCKMGNYRYVNGQFVEVPRGEGTHVKVRESKVNWDSNRVKVNVM